MTEKVLVVGGTGLIGNALVRAWAAEGHVVSAATYHCHPSAAFRQLDMQNERAVTALMDELKPGLVAVPAANPFVDYCEKHAEETRRLNVGGTLNVAKACEAVGARMIFFSSDYVFDGRKPGGLYKEEDRVSPLNEYGRQKAEVEERLLAMSPRHLVIRTAGAYGWQWEPKNFVLQIKGKLERKERIRVVSDVRYTPTYAEELADCVVTLATARKCGIFHVVGSENISRYDFAVLAAATFGLDPQFIDQANSGDFPAAAPRPKESSLSTAKLMAEIGKRPSGAGKGLRKMARFEAEWRRYASKLPAASSA